MNTQTTILDRALKNCASGMALDAARFFLAIRLDPSDLRRANELAAKAREGSLTTDEQREIDEYRRVGRFIEMLKVRARTVLNHAE